LWFGIEGSEDLERFGVTRCSNFDDDLLVIALLLVPRVVGRCWNWCERRSMLHRRKDWSVPCMRDNNVIERVVSFAEASETYPDDHCELGGTSGAFVGGLSKEKKLVNY
jgi:hypothetical protein